MYSLDAAGVRVRWRFRGGGRLPGLFPETGRPAGSMLLCCGGESVATPCVMHSCRCRRRRSPGPVSPFVSLFLSHALPRARLAHLITHLPPLRMLLPRIKQPRHVTLTGTAASSMHASTNLITQTQTSIRTAPALHAALHNYFLQVIKHCLYTVGTVPFFGCTV